MFSFNAGQSMRFRPKRAGDISIPETRNAIVQHRWIRSAADDDDSAEEVAANDQRSAA